MSSLAVCLACNSLNRYDPARAEHAVCGRCRKALPVHDGVVDVNVAGLQKLIDSSPVPVVVDFWAPWCGPCLQFAPTFQSAAKRRPGKAVFAKLNTESDPGSGQAHNVRGIPTLIVFDKARERSRISGALPPRSFDQWLENAGI